MTDIKHRAASLQQQSYLLITWQKTHGTLTKIGRISSSAGQSINLIAFNYLITYRLIKIAGNSQF